MKDYTRTKNSLLNILTGITGQLLNIILKFVCRTVFINTLGASYLGINGLFSDVLSMLSLAELGFDTAICFRLYKPISQRNERKVRDYIVFFRNVYRIVGAVIFVLGLLFIPFIKFFIKDYDSLATLGINASFIFVLFLFQNVSSYLFFAYKSIIFKVNQKQYVSDVANFFVTILSTVLQIIVLYVLKDYIAYIITVTTFVIIQNFVNAKLATRLFPQYFKGKRGVLTRTEKFDIFKDCSALFVYKINNVVMKATDNLVLSAFVGLAIVGLYSNYVMIFVAISGVLNTLFRAVKASMGNLFVSDNISKKYFFFEVMNIVTILLYGTAGVGVAIVSNELIEIWLGPKYILPQPIPILIGAELLVTGLKLNLAQIRHVSVIFMQMWFRPVIGSIINVVTSIILVQYLGVSGVIIGTLLAAVFANLIVDPVVIHKYSFKGYKPVLYYYKKNILFVVVVIAVGAFDYEVCRLFLTGHGIVSLVAHSVICALSVLIMFSLIFYSRSEYQYIINKLKEIVKQRMAFGK